VETAATIIGSLAAILAALVKFVPSVRAAWLAIGDRFRKTESAVTASRQLKASLREMRRVAALKALLQRWVDAKGLQRALVLVASNGGDAWKGAGPLYVSNPAQAVGPGEPNTQKLWQGWRADPWYTEFLGKLLETVSAKRGMLIVRDNNVAGELGLQYADQGTVASIVLPFLWQEGGVLWYVSLNFGHAVTGENPMSSADEAQYAENTRSMYNRPGYVRAMIDDLRGAYQSVE